MFNREAVAKARYEQGVTIGQLAEVARVTPRQILRFLSGHAEPRFSEAAGIARVLELDLASLYVHEGEVRTASSARG